MACGVSDGGRNSDLNPSLFSSPQEFDALRAFNAAVGHGGHGDAGGTSGAGGSRTGTVAGGEENGRLDASIIQAALGQNIIALDPILADAMADGRLSFSSQANMDAFEALLADPAFADLARTELGQGGELHIDTAAAGEPSHWDPNDPSRVFISEEQANGLRGGDAGLDFEMRAYLVLHELGHWANADMGGAPHAGIGQQDDHSAFIAPVVSRLWGIADGNLTYGDTPVS